MNDRGRIRRQPVARSEVLPVDHLLAAYNGVLAVIWAALIPAVWYAVIVSAAHGAAIALPMLLRHVRGRACLPVRFLREAYPFLWLPALWLELDPLIGFLHSTTIDGFVLSLDAAIFRVHLDRVWMPAMPQVWFSEMMHFFYYAYYALIFLPPLMVALQGRPEAVRDMTLRLMATYTGCYLVYLAFPSIGPHEFGATYEGALSGGPFYRLVAAAHASGNVRGAAFPSSHVAAATTIALLGHRWLSRGFALILDIEAVGVFLSTVYTQNHYAIDAVTGVLFALAVQTIVVPIFQSSGRTSRRPQALPVLPVPPLATRVSVGTGGGP